MEEYPRRVQNKYRIIIPHNGNFETLAEFINYISDMLTMKAKELGFNVFAEHTRTNFVRKEYGKVIYEVRRV